MKVLTRNRLIALMMGVLSMGIASNALGQDTSNAAPAPNTAAPATSDTVSAAPGVVQDVNGIDPNDPGALYDSSIIDPSVGERTNKNLEAARQTLTATHDTPIPGVKEPRDEQALPGERYLDSAIEQITELNEIKSGPAVTLKEALLMVDAQNVDLEAAKMKIETARAQLKQAWAIILPNISATFSYAHMGYPTDGTASTRSVISTLGTIVSQMSPEMGAGLTAAADALPKANVQDALSFGFTFGLSIVNVAGWFSLRMADEAVNITTLGVEEGRQQILAGAAQAYMAALLCGEVVKVQRVQLKSALDQLQLAQGRYDRGADVKLSVIQAQFSVEKQRQALIDAIWSYETARDALANLLDMDGLPVPQPAHIKSVNITTDEALEEEALSQNRTLKINRMTQHVNELNLNSAIASFMPTLSGAWKFGYDWAAVDMIKANSDGSASSSRSWNGSMSWTLAFSLNIPLFDYSKFGVLDEKKAAIRSTELSIRSTENSTRTAVRKAKREYYSALFSVDNAKRQVALAREALQLQEAAYSNGASTFIDVTNARNNVASASIAYITASIQSELSMISLISTLGRDIMEVVY